MDARAPTRMTQQFATTLATRPRSPGSDIPNSDLQDGPQKLLLAGADWRR